MTVFAHENQKDTLMQHVFVDWASHLTPLVALPHELGLGL